MEDTIIKNKMQTVMIVCNAVGLLICMAVGLLLVCVGTISIPQFLGLGLLGWSGGLLAGLVWALVIRRGHAR